MTKTQDQKATTEESSVVQKLNSLKATIKKPLKVPISIIISAMKGTSNFAVIARLRSSRGDPCAITKQKVSMDCHGLASQALAMTVAGAKKATHD